MTASNLVRNWSTRAPQLLSVLRIVAAFLFMQFGTAKIFAFPAAIMPGGGTAPIMSLPGIAGIGAVTAARLLNQYGPIEDFPATVLGDGRERALLFKQLATLRTDAPLFRDVNELEWRGPTDAFVVCAQRLGDERLPQRITAHRREHHDGIESRP